jgi:tRNA dimethylallyltransferase
MEKDPTLHFLAGVTASGKSKLALEWAESRAGEILSCDSIAIYRGMDLGSAKPTSEERLRVTHHGLDLAEVSEGYDVSRYERYAREIVTDVCTRGRALLIVGGSGFYLQSFFEPIIDEVEVTDEIRGQVADLHRLQGISGLLDRLNELNEGKLLGLDERNPQRLQRALERCLGSGLKLSELRKRFESLPAPYPSFAKKCIWLDRTDEDLAGRIEKRTKAMIKEGLVEETESLVEQGFLTNHSASGAVGYREAYAFLRNEISRADLVSSICISTRQLVAKQRKWFRKRFPPESRLLLGSNSIVCADELKWRSGT